MNSSGVVYLVGAGPGDPGLLTLRGRDCLARADVVLFDYLVNDQILEHAPPAAQRICRGRHGQGRLLTQTEINQQMVAAAQAGKTVVRLKGGDPAVFGHLAEEVAALEAAGIRFEIVPGITAWLAASAYAQVPLTDRAKSSAVSLVTGQETREKTSEGLDYASLAQFPGTLVFYMGVTTAGSWSEALIHGGKPPQTPVLVIRRCSWPDQKSFRCSLAEVSTLLDQSRPDKIRPPVLVIVGEVAAETSASCWFTDRPLFGQTILVTRAADQAGSLREQLSELGAEVLLQPAIQIGPPQDWGPVDAALQRLEAFDWLVFSSSNGVRYLLHRLWELGFDWRKLAHTQLAAIGPGTAAELERHSLRVDCLPETYRAEAMAAALAGQAAGKRFLLARASRGREVLCEQLQAAGGEVEQIVVYQSDDTPTPDPEIAARLAAGQIDWVTATSSAIARSLHHLFGDSLTRTKLVSISPITSGDLRALGLEPAAEASEYTMDGVIAAILRTVSRA